MLATLVANVSILQAFNPDKLFAFSGSGRIATKNSSGPVSAMPAKRKHDVENAAEMSATERRVEKAAVLDRIQLLAQEVMHLTPPVALSHSIEYYRFMALKATTTLMVSRRN